MPNSYMCNRKATPNNTVIDYKIASGLTSFKIITNVMIG